MLSPINYLLIHAFLFGLGFNPHADSPVEPLHTLLLGTVKYGWGMTTAMMNTAGVLDVFESRLRSADVKGLNIDPIRASYIVQYRGSLIGRNFRSIIQTIAFVLFGLVSDEMVNMWVAMGHMVSLLWYPEIRDISQYCVSRSFISGTPFPLLICIRLSLGRQ